MKVNGEFVVRQVMENIVAIPVGQTALRFNGMLFLNEVSKVIWDCLQQDTDLSAIVTAVTEVYEVSAQEAEMDILEFLDQLRKVQLLEE